jgi:hypothetical protein
MGKHWAVETESSKEGRADVDFVRGDRPDDPQTPEDAEKEWRRLRQLYFLSGVTVRRTTDEEDVRLQAGLDEIAQEKAERAAMVAEARKAQAHAKPKHRPKK